MGTSTASARASGFAAAYAPLLVSGSRGGGGGALRKLVQF